MQKLSVVNTTLIASLLHLPCQSSPRDFYSKCPKIKYCFCELSNYVDVEIPCFCEGFMESTENIRIWFKV